MLRIFSLCLFVLLTACVTVQPKEDEEYIDITDILKPPKPKVITKVVREGSGGCPPMPQVKLLPTPKAPKAALSRLSADDYRAMDGILLNYIKQLRSTNDQNIVRVRNAIAENNRKCKR